MNDYRNITAKCVFLYGCDLTGQMNEILKSQTANFLIYDIQMVKDNGSHYAWIFYQGEYPTTKEANSQ